MAEEDKQEREKELENWLVTCTAIGLDPDVCRIVKDDGDTVLVDVLTRKKTDALRVRSVAILLCIRWAA